jgi:hypothetical protein
MTTQIKKIYKNKVYTITVRDNKVNKLGFPSVKYIQDPEGYFVTDLNLHCAISFLLNNKQNK